MESRKPSHKDYYAVLGVDRESDAGAIKKAYRALVQRYHPDRIKDREEVTNASERMIEINEAFAVLADTKRRAELDRTLSSGKAGPVTEEPPEEDWQIPVSPAKE